MAQNYTRNQPLDNDVTLAADSPFIAVTQHATKTYTDNKTAAASETFQGTAELATQTETNTGTDDNRIVTPLKLKSTPIDHLKVSKIYESDAGAAALSADATGYLAAAVQPLVSAYNSATDTDVTGDATAYTVIFNTEVFDRNSNYNNSNGVFTAPVTGNYLILSTVHIIGILSTHTYGRIILTTSNRSYVGGFVSPYGAATVGGLYSFIFSAIADMDASDTAAISVQVSNGTKVVDVYGASTDYTNLMIYLLP